MVMTFVPVLVSLERNMQRDRSLMPSIVLRTWRDVNKNIDTYKKTFGDNISIVNTNTDKDLSVFSKDKLKKYFEQSKAVGKPKTLEEQQKSQAEREQLVSDIEQMSIKLPTTDTLEQSKTKITNFISK